MQISERILWVRQALGMSQRDFAQELGVSSGAIAQWETAKRETPANIIKLLEVYEAELGFNRTAQSSNVLFGARRNLKVAAAVFQLARALLDHHVSEQSGSELLRIQRVNSLAKTLGSLKGISMKIGQMIGLMETEWPAHLRDRLLQLHQVGESIDPKLIAAIFQKDFGKLPKELFAEWSELPFATASLGQVHWAKLKTGEPVAVKVQYPEIEKAIRTDLKNLKVLSQFSSLYMPGQDKSRFINEVRDRFLEECDYELERKNQEDARRYLSADCHAVVPKVFSDLSTKAVLTSEFFPGRNFREFVRLSSQTERSQAAETIFRVWFQLLFRHNFFHADPHPGNLMFDGQKVAFIDFGCVKRFSPESLETWRGFLKAILEGDMDGIREIAYATGLTDASSKFDFSYFYKMLQITCAPWLKNETFQFDAAYIQSVRAANIGKNTNWRRTNLPQDWLFLNRFQMGLFPIMAELKAEGNWHQIVAPLLYEA